jgi:hypothetical protein
MKHTWSTFLLAGMMAAVIISCKNDENAAGPIPGQGAVSGIVIDAATQTGLDGVTISAEEFTGGTAQQTTGSNGRFRVSFEIDSTSSVVITFSKTGYRDTTIVFNIASNTITPATVVLTPRSVFSGGGGGGGTTPGTGLAHDIAFLGADPQEIAVHGVGSVETALLKWEVRDSLGIPIDAAHAIVLTVSVQNGPGGGEYVSPSPITTDANGQAFTTLTSGIRSGVVQVVATGTVQSPGGGTVQLSTSPVRVIINAGFPDQAHFTVAPAIHNLPVLFVVNASNSVSVLVGDKYSNPVTQKTAVYFKSSAGVIQPSVFTNANGQGTVSLISGNPLPLGIYATPVHGDGYHFVVATTVGQGGVTVTDSTLMLWSGRPLITNFAPLTFAITNGSSQTFTFTVADYLGHPLAAGTAIAITATIPPPPDPNTQQNQVTVALFPGGIDGTRVLEDELFPGPGITDFSCKLSDGSTGITEITPVTLSVSVSGPNGSAVFTIDGTVQ